METQPVIPEKRKFNIFRFLLKTVLWLFASVVFIIGVAIALVFIYEDEVKAIVVNELNKNLNAEIRIDPKNIDLTVIRTFPNASIDFKDATCFEAVEKDRDTLFTAKRISLEFNIMDLFHKKYDIKKIGIHDVDMRLKVDKKGRENYIIWKTDHSTDTSGAVNFALEKIELSDIKVSYRNRQNKTKLAFTLSDAEFSGRFNDKDYTMKSEGVIHAETIVFKDRNYLNNKKIRYNINLQIGTKEYLIKTAALKINEVELNTQGKFMRVDSLLFADITFEGKNLDVKTAMSLLPESAQNRVKDYESEGEFYAKGILKGLLNADETPEMSADFGVKNAKITYKPNNVTLEQVNFTGSYKNMHGEESLDLNGIHATLKNNLLEGNYHMVNFSDPYLNIDFKANAELKDVLSFYPIDTIAKLSGKMQLEAEIKGKLEELKKDFSGSANYSKGTAWVSDIVLQFKNDKKEITIPSASFALNGKDVSADSLNIKLGSSDARISGKLVNFVPWVLRKNEPLGVQATYYSSFVSLDELISSDLVTDKGSATTSSEFDLPENISMQLNLNIASTTLGKFSAKNIAGKITLKNKQLFSDNLSFESMGGDIALSGLLDATGEKLRIKGSAKLVNIDVNRMMIEMNNFSQNEITDKHIKGIGTCSFDFSTLWDRKFNCDQNSIEVVSDVTLEQGELNDYKPLEKLAKFIEMKELQHIRFNTLQTHLEIRNKTISISKTLIGNSALNVEFFGSQTFDDKIDYHIKLLLSELLARKPNKNKQLEDELELVENDAENKRCVFILMTGTLDDPIIKFDRKAMKEKVKEDIKAEKQNLKGILKEEFGWFKKDTTLINKKEENKKADQKFIIDTGEKPKQKKKKEEEEEEDF
jgi:hypothetical protein